MKWFLFLLAIGFVACDKLDRTYLPPVGAKFAGGSPDDIQTPFEPPKDSKPGATFLENGIPTQADGPSQTQYTYYPENVPTTTTSYAFSQTTTLPPFEIYKVTGAPIDLVSEIMRFPGQNIGNFDYGLNSENTGSPSYAQTPVLSSGENIPDYITDERKQYGRPTNVRIENPYYQDQFTNSITDSTQTPQLIYQEGINSGQPQFVSGPSTLGPQNINSYPQDTKFIQPGSGETFDGIKTTFESNSFPVQPQDLFERKKIDQPTTDQQILLQQSPKQKGFGENSDTFQPGSSSTTVSSLNYQNPIGIFSTTPMPSEFPSTSYPSTVSYETRPARPQAASDRNAVIINFKNNRTPNGYSYSYDTSNGIHADESGIVDNGNKAKGGFSYTGDDGKIYSITYTADENGFQPRGDHLPTPPPIPEAIQKVIEQAARDREAGIFDDGSYDEKKYGDNTYQGSRGPVVSNYYNSNRNDNLKNSQYNDDKYNMEPENYAISSSEKTSGETETKPDLNKPIGNFHSQINIEDNLAPKGILSGVKPTTDGYSEPRDGSTAKLNSNYPNAVSDMQKPNGSYISRLSNRPGEVTFTGTNYEQQPYVPNAISTVRNNKNVDYPTISQQYDTTAKPTVTQDSRYVDFDGANNQYLPPKTKFVSNNTPSSIGLRMNTSPKPKFIGDQDSTAKPFMTPNVKNNIYNNPIESFAVNNAVSGDDIATIPKELYFNNQENTKVPSETTVNQTPRPYETTRNTPKYSIYTPSSEELTVTQKGTPISRRPNYFIQSTTPVPKQTTRFGPIQSNNMPSNFEYHTSSTTMMPAISINAESSKYFRSGQPNNKFASGPASDLSTVNVTPGSSPADFTFGTRLPAANRKGTKPITPTSTYKPTSDYGITVHPAESFRGLGIPKSAAPATPNTYETGYQYGPGISPLGYSNRPTGLKPDAAKLTPSGPGMYSQVPIGSTYQSGYQYGPVPDISRPVGSLSIDSNSKPTKDQELPNNYRESYGRISTTTATPVKFLMSDTPGSTTGFSTRRTPNDSLKLVDNFGRPIKYDPSYSDSSKIPSNGNNIDRKLDDYNISNVNGSANGPLNESSNRDYGTTDIVKGEDFSGPKRPQSFDPETGYYY